VGPGFPWLGPSSVTVAVVLIAMSGADALDRRRAAEQRYAKRLAHTKPTTPVGVAALIQYILDDD
jgi:hypothetical protein